MGALHGVVVTFHSDPHARQPQRWPAPQHSPSHAPQSPFAAHLRNIALLLVGPSCPCAREEKLC